MKVKVIKEMPFEKVGAIIEVLDNGYFRINNSIYVIGEIEDLIERGWLEEVKDDDTRLEKIITNVLESYGMPKFKDRFPAKDIIQVMKDAGWIQREI